MGTARVHKDLRCLRGRQERGELTQCEAAELLGLTTSGELRTLANGTAAMPRTDKDYRRGLLPAQGPRFPLRSGAASATASRPLPSAAQNSVLLSHAAPRPHAICSD